MSASRFGDISPAFAATCGASVDVAFPLRARTARARAQSAAAHAPRIPGPRAVLPLAIASPPVLLASRVQTAIVAARIARR
jgi:hypothetical protein